MGNKRLLISYAHPDDESFGLGAIIAKYVKEGVDAYLICATNGDAGTVSKEMLNGYNSIAELRLAELDCASQKLGFKKVFTFGYRDSGMMGQEVNQHPECLWYRWHQEPETLIKQVVEVMREIRPQVVVTFNKYGGYGHPDHIAIQQATTRAFDRAGKTGFVTDYAPYQPQKLYYSSIPKIFIRLNIWWILLQGKDPRKYGVNHDIDMQKILDNADFEHANISIKAFLEDWDEASACHASQGGGGFLTQYPLWLRRLWITHQGFTRIYPAPMHNVVDEYDLFQNVELP